MAKIVGLLLAGGRATRLGGADKALLSLAGRPLLAHGIARLAPQCAALVLSANGDPARFAAALPVVTDGIDGSAGPLAGLAAALDWIFVHHPDARHAVSVTVDTPFAPEDLVARLDAARRAANADIAVATSGGRTHHAVALWPVSLRGAIREAAASGDRSVGRFAHNYRLATTDWPADPNPFFNINTFADLIEAERRVTHAPCAAET